MVTANEIRDYVKENLIDPARRNGKHTITFKASEIHEAMVLKDRHPLVCSSIDAEKFLDFAHLILVWREGPKQSSTVVWTFDLK